MVRLCEHKPLLINALALLALPIGSAFTLLSGTEEALLRKLFCTKDICITLTLSKVRGVRGWMYIGSVAQELGGAWPLMFLIQGAFGGNAA